MSTAGTKGVPRAERERQILNAAADQFGAAGYAAMSIGAVAEQAGISKPLIYAYFDSKEGLYLACLTRAGEALIAAIDSVAQVKLPLLLAARTLTAIFTALEQRPHDWNVIYDRSLPPGSEAAAAAKRVRAHIAGQAGRGVAALLDARDTRDPLDYSALAEVWMSTVTALVNWWLKHPDQTAEQMSARCSRLLAALAPGQG